MPEESLFIVLIIVPNKLLKSLKTVTVISYFHCSKEDRFVLMGSVETED